MSKIIFSTYMMDSNEGHLDLTSEVGTNEQRNESRPRDDTYGERLLSSMQELLTRVLAVQQTPNMSTNQPLLLSFDPDDADANIDDWCKITEVIVLSKGLEGVNLLVALMGALKGRAASCLTKLNLKDITWSSTKEILIAKFTKPKLIQDYFDDILRFQIGSRETATESALRLWNLVERIPKSTMAEEVITGFVISILCQKDNLLRRELNAQAITCRSQLLRILGGISLKRRLDIDVQETEGKRQRVMEKFIGKCHYCGLSGHRKAECRKRHYNMEQSFRDTPSSSRNTETRTAVTCYTCGQPGHVATICPNKKHGSGAAVKEVHQCEHRPSRGTLTTSSGEPILFLFDSGSSCSLLKESFSNKLDGTVCKNLVYLTGIGGNDLQCTTQIQSDVTIDELTVTLVFHVVPDSHILDPIIIGRDIFDQGLCVKVDHDSLKFFSKKNNYFCDISPNSLELTKIDSDLDGHDREALISLLNKYSKYFTEGIPSRRVQTGECVINLIDKNKVVQRCPYRLAPSEKDIVREKVQQLLDAGVIRESSSPFASPILLVTKKDNSYRMCVDYRELNSNTQSEHYPLPRIEDQIDQLAGAKLFSSLDMASGFHQIVMHPDSVEKTAFVTPEGQYEYLAMPFGLRNAPSIYQRCITRALNHLSDKPLIYMDDVLCYSRDVAEGLERLDKVLSALTEAGFTLNLQKCKFLKHNIDYLGYSLRAGEIRPNSRKIQALANSPQPKTATQVRQFLGLASYFRKFIHDFTHIVGPLYPLTKLKGPITWSKKHENIRNTIIGILTSEPVLTIFDPNIPVEVHTDASSEGYGAILIQRKNNLPHVVEYYSRRTSDAESRYHSYELETLAVVRAVEHFRHYLYGRHFLVFTDCNSLKSSKSKRDLTPRVHRWWAILQAYDFDIVYREGKTMEHADYFSRNPLPDVDASGPSLKNSQTREIQYVELHQDWLSVEQKRDSEIQDLISKHNNNEFPDSLAQTYDVREGILYRKIVRNKIISWLPVVPRSLVWTLINHVHNEIQHLGKDKTLDKLYEQYWFPQMSKCVRQFIDSCIICKVSKGPSGAQPIRLHPIPKVSIPWHTIHIDFTGKLSGKSDRKEYCSVIIDGFTKYVLLEHTSSLDAKSAICALQKAVCLFGAPKRIIADQGRCYISSDFKNFCNQHKIEIHFIATGSSRANGQVERIMRTLKSLLTIVENDPHKTWREELGNIQLALNSTKSSVTKYSPTELMLGIRSQSLGISKLNSATHSQQGHLDLDAIREEASANIEKAAMSDARRFSRGRALIKPFAIGEFVFLKNSERNQTKLAKKFRGPFVITSVLENDRYELKSLGGSHRMYKYAHENLRSVPKGHEGLLEMTENLLNNDDSESLSDDVMNLTQFDLNNTLPLNNAITAPDDVETVSLPGPNKALPTSNCDSLTVCSDTVSADSHTMTADSETLSAYSDSEVWEIQNEIEITTREDNSP